MITSMRIIPNSLSLRIGETYPLGLSTTPSGEDVSQVSWESSNTEVVEISGTIVQARGYGLAVITASIDGISAACNIEVIPSLNGEEEQCSTEAPEKADKRWLDTDRIYAQYRDKPNATRWYNITRKVSYPLWQASQQIRKMYSIDDNVGAQLDIIGRIVGVDRSYISDVAMKQSMYAPNAEGAMFGDPESMYSSGVVAGNLAMSDELFRLKIKAKIIKNNTNAYYDSILEGFKALFPHINDMRIDDYEDMSFSITYVGQLSPLEQWALMNIELLPKPAGVRFRGFMGVPVGLVQVGDYTKQVGDTNSQAMNINLVR